MIIVLKPHSSDEDVQAIEHQVTSMGYIPHTIRGEVRTVVAAVGDESEHPSLESLVTMPMVENVMPVQKKYKLISRETHAEAARVKVGDLTIGGGSFHIIAGPCSIESYEQLKQTAVAVHRAGCGILRGGAYKPRTSPYTFQGLGDEGLDILRRVKEELNIPVVTEIVRENDIAKVAKVADILQIGARNALNYSLLEAAAETGKPIFLKRGLAAKIEEWLLAAEYIVKSGNRNVILCERGIRTFETATRNTLDLSAVVMAKREISLPVFVDPSHAAGRWDLIEDLSKAAAAAGADGLMVEVHRHPEAALSDGGQQLTPDQFDHLVKAVEPFVEVAGKKFAGRTTSSKDGKKRLGWAQ